jgi:hypothetical protein
MVRRIGEQVPHSCLPFPDLVDCGSWQISLAASSKVKFESYRSSTSHLVDSSLIRRYLPSLIPRYPTIPAIAADSTAAIMCRLIRFSEGGFARRNRIFRAYQGEEGYQKGLL